MANRDHPVSLEGGMLAYPPERLTQITPVGILYVHTDLKGSPS